MAEPELVIEDYKQWELAGGRFQGPQPVVPLARFSEGSDKLHNLKNSKLRKFLQWEKQTFGINLGWTDDASASTAKKVARWFFTHKDGGSGPITYGETFAMGYGKDPSFVRYENRDVGVNLGWTSDPVFEWKLIGGTAGQAVKTGEWLAIYNERAGNFLIYFDRTAGVDIGWPDSTTWLQKGVQLGKDAAERYVRSYVGG